MGYLVIEIKAVSHLIVAPQNMAILRRNGFSRDARLIDTERYRG